MLFRLIFVFIVFSAFFSFVPRLVAQTPEATPTIATDSSYNPPSIRILPGNPLYALELIWDKLSLLFTSQPHNKAVKYITLADRELTAASTLINNGSFPLGLHTAFRGEHYMTLFVNKMKEVASNAGSLDTSAIRLAHNAFSYHKQLLSNMIGKSSGDIQSSFKSILEFSQRNDNELTNVESEFSTPTNLQQ